MRSWLCCRCTAHTPPLPTGLLLPSALQETLKKDPYSYFYNVQGPPFADPAGCPSYGNDTAGGPFYFSSSSTPANVAYAKSLGNARALCDLGTRPVYPTDFYPAMKNMVDPSQNYTFLDPRTACNAPIWDSFSPGLGLPNFVQFSALCYCNGALQGSG